METIKAKAAGAAKMSKLERRARREARGAATMHHVWLPNGEREYVVVELGVRGEPAREYKPTSRDNALRSVRRIRARVAAEIMAAAGVAR